MIDLKELYEQGHRRFLFSDGVVREPIDVDWSRRGDYFKFPVLSEPDIGIYYENGGTDNLRDGYPKVIGVPGESPQNVNLIRDDNGKWWLEVPQSATVHDITKAAEVLNNV